MPIADGVIVSVGDKFLLKIRLWTKGSILNAANSLPCIFGRVGLRFAMAVLRIDI